MKLQNLGSKKLAIAVAVFILVTTAFVLAYFKLGSRVNLRGPSKAKIATTIFPLYDIVKNVASNEIDVVVILKPGASPHTFDPTPKDAEALSKSKILFAIGHNLDNWAFKMATSVGVDKIVTVDKYISLIQSQEADEPGVNPHYWLSVKNATLIAKQVKEELSTAFPDKEAVFEENYQNYSKRLNTLDSEVQNELAGLPNRDIATFHAAWDYFAKDYNLNVVATFEEFPGKEPTPEYLADFQKKIKESNIKVIFAEPQFSTAALVPVAKDLGVEIIVIDPEGGGIPGVKTYEEMTRYNVNRIQQALK